MSDKFHMHEGGESYCGVVPAKQPNRGAQSPAEVVEGRPKTKENTSQPNLRRTQSRERGPSGLGRVREAARKDQQLRFTALLHHITIDQLRRSYQALKRDAAAGVDGVTWAAYGEHLEEQLRDLQGRIHRGAYRARPSRRTWIAKADGRQRPLGIAALEDKIVQHAVGTVLSQIWEEDFLGFSYGFRPGRSQHDALDALWVAIMRRKVNWIVELDIRAFFDHMDHAWLIKFVEHRIGDQRVVRLIQKWLKAGVLEDGQWRSSEEGTPQGAVISPLLANLYLHYVLDQWVHQWRRRQAHGEVIVVRYADDVVLGFEHQQEAQQFVEQVRERLQQFGLELHPEKTRLIEFGRHAAANRAKQGKGKPETFDFLGFTHVCGTSHKRGRFIVKRQTVRKRISAKLQAIRLQLKQRRHQSNVSTVKWLQAVVRGYFQYHAIPGNWARMEMFRKEVQRHWLRQLRQRSQRNHWTWARFLARLGDSLPPVCVAHPYPNERFDAKYPR